MKFIRATIPPLYPDRFPDGKPTEFFTVQTDWGSIDPDEQKIFLYKTITPQDFYDSLKAIFDETEMLSYSFPIIKHTHITPAGDIFLELINGWKLMTLKEADPL